MSVKTLRKIGFVYVVEGDERVKIGRSRTPLNRIRTVRNSAGIKGGREWVSCCVNDCIALEAMAHAAFEPTRIVGEFFGVDFDSAVDTIRQLSQGMEADGLSEDQLRKAKGMAGELVFQRASQAFSGSAAGELPRMTYFRSALSGGLNVDDIVAVAMWAAGDEYAVFSRSSDEESFFCFDGLVGDMEHCTLAAIFRAIAYASQFGVVYGAGRDNSDDSDFVLTKQGDRVPVSLQDSDHAAVAAAIREYLAGKK